MYRWDFPDVKFRVAAQLAGSLSLGKAAKFHSVYTISEKAIRFRDPDYDPDRAQKLISSFMSRHLSTRNISCKSMHAFLSNLAIIQTDRQTRANAFTSSFVGGIMTQSIAQLICDSWASGIKTVEDTQCDKIRSFLIVVLYVSLIVFFMLF